MYLIISSTLYFLCYQNYTIKREVFTSLETTKSMAVDKNQKESSEIEIESACQEQTWFVLVQECAGESERDVSAAA